MIKFIFQRNLINKLIFYDLKKIYKVCELYSFLKIYFSIIYIFNI